MDQFSRTRRVIGGAAVERLAACRVAVFGLGGVGSYAVEALARGGVGALDLIDDDKVCLTNLNRQLYALHSTLGEYKADVAAARVRDINPACAVRVFRTFYTPETKDKFDFSQYDYVVDAIDTVSGKIGLVEQADAAGVPIICAMGAGNKLDPSAFEAADLFCTSMDPLARVMRRELKKRGIRRLKVVYSKEEPLAPQEEEDGAEEGGASPLDTARGGPARRASPGSVSFVPPVVGFMLAGEVIRDLIETGPKDLHRAKG